MRFKTDENMPREVADYLRDCGHDAMRVDEQGLNGVVDPGVAAVCLVEQRVIVILDTDFMDIRRYPPGLYHGIVVLRPNRQSVSNILTLTRRFLMLLPFEPLSGKLWIVDEGRVRIRPDEAD